MRIRKAMTSLLLSVLAIVWVVNPMKVLAADTDSNQVQGNSFLEIVPLDSDSPWLESINDLDFKTRDVSQSGMKFNPAEDLKIRIIDDRLQDNQWELQLSTGALRNEKGQVLKDAKITIGEGTIDSTDQVGIATKTYTSINNETGFQTILYSSATHRRGWTTYTIKKEDITLSFGAGNPTGKYSTINNWRMQNALY